MKITNLSELVSQLTVVDVIAILEQSGYSGFTINTVEYAGRGDNEQYVAVFACTDDDDSGTEPDGVVRFNVFITATKNGELKADF